MLPRCFPCAAGKFAGIEGTVQCSPCPAGTSSNQGASFCTPCALGKYAPNAGSAVCSVCPLGRSSELTGEEVDSLLDLGESCSCPLLLLLQARTNVCPARPASTRMQPPASLAAICARCGSCFLGILQRFALFTCGLTFALESVQTGKQTTQGRTPGSQNCTSCPVRLPSRFVAIGCC